MRVIIICWAHRSALLIAIDNENIEMIQLLLKFNVELGDSLLHAIDEENVIAVELLLHAYDQQKQRSDLNSKVYRIMIIHAVCNPPLRMPDIIFNDISLFTSVA